MFHLRSSVMTRIGACCHRQIRTRSLAVTTDSLRRAVLGEPKSAGHRPAPNSVLLDSVASEIAQVGELQTDVDVWSAKTINDAWRLLHESLRAAAAADDPSRGQELKDKDLKALAWCTSRSEVQYLLELFAPALRTAIMNSTDFSTSTVEEFFMHVGMDMEVRGDTWLLRLPPPTLDDLQHTLRMVGRFGADGRGCIESTAHRVSVWRGRDGESLGITVRVGRYVPNAARALLPLAEKGSVLILSPAGMGKTTLLRDLAASIANSITVPRVAVVDTSNEIGGDGPVPMPFLGRCRRIQVPKREQLSQVMAEVIQNHSPEYLIVDELVSSEEAQAAWSISQRGVRLVATCHGETLDGLLQNQALKLLVGGTAQAFLSNEERRLRRKDKKTVLERPYSSPFRYVVELNDRNAAFIYMNVNKAVDLILDDQKPKTRADVGDNVLLMEALPDRLLQWDERQASNPNVVCSASSSSNANSIGGDANRSDSNNSGNNSSASTDSSSTSSDGNRSGGSHHHRRNNRDEFDDAVFGRDQNAYRSNKREKKRHHNDRRQQKEMQDLIGDLSGFL